MTFEHSILLEYNAAAFSNGIYLRNPGLHFRWGNSWGTRQQHGGRAKFLPPPPMVPGRPHYRCFTITSDTSHSVRLLWTSNHPSKRPLLGNTQQSQETVIHASGGIRTDNPSKRAAADTCLRRGHWHQLANFIGLLISLFGLDI